MNKEQVYEIKRAYDTGYVKGYKLAEKKYKEVIDKANNWVRNYMDEWSINDEAWQELNELLILLEEVE